MMTPVRLLPLVPVLAAALLAPAAVDAQTATPASPAAASAPLVQLPDFTRLVEQVSPAVVNIEATSTPGAGAKAQGMPEGEEIPEIFRRFIGPGMPQPQQRGGVSQGTGFVTSADGYIITNHHVIDGADKVIVRFNDRRELEAKIVGSDALSDIAVLKVEATGLPAVRIGDARSLKPGQWVVAIGSPFGFDYSVTAGIVSGVNRRSLDPGQQYVPFIQTDVAINRGNSGGPLLNVRGEVVGVNSQIFSNTGGFIGVSFAIPVDVAMNTARQLRESGTVRRGVLGVQIGQLTRERAQELGLPRPVGAFVNSVNNGSAADKAGIRPGDVITAFNGREILTASDLPPQVGLLPPGSRATVTVLRDGGRRDLVVSLDALDGATAGAPATPVAPAAAPANALGLATEAVDAATRQRLGLQAGEGVRISRVGSALARQAGLNPGDVVLAVNGRDVGTAAAFEAELGKVKAGSMLRLLVRNASSTGFVELPMP
ncbi:Do family serine endopeptidase [Silanimonas sp.]|uniref:Do family serine endopeptidase n=1 Tax=Silanimonas sp. TaxID=1929290 RepID=UPI0022BD7160|nr:Do family serine endopeptidase [Silanimonas sp.]MCZ8061429.1 Do family serine endopeptidase [Silanimonas sp.]